MILKTAYKAVILLIITCNAFSQKDKVLLPRFAIRAECNVPKVIGSQAYRISFNGLYDGGIKFTSRLMDNFCIGLGYDNALFNTTTQFRDAYGRNINTRQQVHNGVFSFIYDKILSEKTFVSISLNTGASYNMYTGVVAMYDSLYKNIPTDFTTAFIKPEISINFLVEDNFAFSINASYNMSLYTFDPKVCRLDKYLNFGQYRNKSNVGWISFGFGFYYGFKRKTKAAS